MQPLNFIASYYGEKVAFYYAWLMFYTSWLLIPAIPGVILFIYQMTNIGYAWHRGEEVTVDSPYTCLYCIIMAIWSTVMIEVWKRRENELIHIWGVKDFKGDESEMPTFKYDYVVDKNKKIISKKSFIDPYFRRLIGETPIVTVCIIIVVLCYIGTRILKKEHNDTTSSVGSSILNAVIIIILGIFYRKIANTLCVWENHRY